MRYKTSKHTLVALNRALNYSRLKPFYDMYMHCAFCYYIRILVQDRNIEAVKLQPLVHFLAFLCKIIVVPFKKVPIVAVLPYKCSDLEGDFPSINKIHSDMVSKEICIL